MQSYQLHGFLWTLFFVFSTTALGSSLLTREKRGTETGAEKTGFSCDGKFITNEKLARIVSEVCYKIRYIDEGDKFPSVYEGNLFDHSDLIHYIYPITNKKSFVSGEPPGPYRVVVDEGCNLAGVTTLVGSNKAKLCDMIGTPSPLIGIDLKTKLKDVMSEDGYKCGPKFFKMSKLNSLVDKACTSVREGRTGPNKFPVKFYSQLFSEQDLWMWPVKVKKTTATYQVVMDKDCTLLGAMFSLNDHYVRCKEVRWGSTQTMMSAKP